MLANFLIALSLLVLVMLAIVAFVGNTNRQVNRLLALFLFSGSIWLFFNLLTNIAPSDESALVFARLTLVGAVLLPFSFLLFTYSFANEKGLSGKKTALLAVPPSLILISTPTEYNVRSATGSNFEPGIIYFALLVLLLTYFIAGIVTLARHYGQANNQRKAQYNYIFIGIILTLIPALTINLALPLLGIGEVAQYGSLSVIFISVFMTLAIVKHRLLDIRLVVVRSLGYILSIGLLVVVIAYSSSIIVQNLFYENPDGIIPSVINIVIFSVVVIMYPLVKKIFDQLTNRIFFRDAYDPQEFLDELNKSIVSNIEIGILLRHTTQIIEDNLKSSFVQIIVPKTESTAQRIAGTQDVRYTDHEINYMRGRLVGLGQKIITSDQLGSEEDELQKIMLKHDISVLVHLSATSYGQDQTIAFMVFGSKMSGNIYSKADLRIIEIVADELVIAIQNALRFEEIQEFNATLQSRVNNATGKLKKTNEKLKAMDETKDEFISMASHQLRTPLTSVKGYLSMVLEGDAGEINETQRKLLDQAFVSSQRMVYLIADLLNVSRLRTGKFVIDAAQANLADIVEGEVSQLTEQAKAKDITLTFEKPESFPDLVFDETKTRQVVMNFVDNALYYTPSGGKIKVSLTEDKSHVYFMVKDNGLGVPKDEQKHLFTKFYRAKNARNIRPDGTGLGLFMAKKVITAQGGNILFESKEGKGSTFGFSLNKKNAAVPDTTS